MVLLIDAPSPHGTRYATLSFIFDAFDIKENILEWRFLLFLKCLLEQAQWKIDHFRRNKGK